MTDYLNGPTHLSHVDLQKLDNAPTNLKHLRACLRCGLIKSFEQFKQEGCENCDNVLHFRGQVEVISACTTDDFQGMTAVINPDRSWVARWQHISESK